MAWQKSPAALIERFDTLVPHDARVQRRKMFGYPAAFVNGHLFVGLHESNLILRVAPNDRAAVAAELDARTFEPMPGRAMHDFVALDGTCLPPQTRLAPWIEKALAYAAEKPAKPTKPVKATRSERSHA